MYQSADDARKTATSSTRSPVKSAPEAADADPTVTNVVSATAASAIARAWRARPSR
jgi:hypothetical protein